MSATDPNGLLNMLLTSTRSDAEISASTDSEPASFPTLPTELRQKIWKHALPGPRVVRYDIVGLLHKDYARVKKASRAMNSSLQDITRVNREAQEIVEKKVPKALCGFGRCEGELRSSLDGSTSKDGSQLRSPFVFIDYELDTLYLENALACRRTPTGRFTPTLHQVFQPFNKVKKLAFSANREGGDWHYYRTPLFRNIPFGLLLDLERLIFVKSEKLTMEDFRDDWQFIDLEVDRHNRPADLLSSEEFWDGIYSEDVCEKEPKMLKKYGSLGFELAEVFEGIHRLQGEVEEPADQSGVSTTFKFDGWTRERLGTSGSISIAFPAVKKQGSSQWFLKYRTHTMIQHSRHYTNIDPDSDDEYDVWKVEGVHNHLEPIIIGNGGLQSCLPAPADPSQNGKEISCSTCGMRRLTEDHDMFWTKKGRDENLK